MWQLQKVLTKQFISLMTNSNSKLHQNFVIACEETLEDKILLEGPICLKNDEVTSIDPLLLARKYSSIT